ncbi:MAG: hypothetical protein J1F33_06330 [Clostridiales bacterium]|nr:hypothetical protein [Clostridiales bacterium]
MSEKKYSANNIEAVLDVGKIFSGVSAVLLYVVLGLTLVAPITTAALGIAHAAKAIVWNGNLTVGVSVVDAASVLVLAYTINVIIENIRNKKNVEAWLVGAVAVNALVRRIPSDSDEYVRNRISVTFELNGENKYIASLPKAWAKDINKSFIRRDGQNVPVMYNEEQNKVMLVRTAERNKSTK